MRTHIFTAALLTTTALTACDTEQEPEIQTLNLDTIVLTEEEAEPLMSMDTIVAEPDVQDDVQCTTFKFTTSQNDSKKSQCSITSPQPEYPTLIPIWDELLTLEMHALASATCEGLGGRDANGNFPTIGMEVDPDAAIDSVTAEQGAAAAGPFGPGPSRAGLPGVLPATAPVCETVCANHGKVWDFTANKHGTCAFNKTITLQAPQHEIGGLACSAAGTQRWESSANVVMDCGCRCI
ncbi:MAG: hypothetical protein AAF799_45740 [Myxococcota bacterium]